MGFIESYKHLEKLCGEILNDDRRVSAYIDEMLNTPRGSYLVSGWDNDLKQLKHYRWVRNQISHEPNCTEENMCEPGDTEWLDDFYSRIMDQTDPLTLYDKATKPRPVQKPTQRYTYYQTTTNNPTSTNTTATTSNSVKTSTQTYKQETYTYSKPVKNKKKSSKHIGCIVFGICVLVVIAAIVWITETI